MNLSIQILLIFAFAYKTILCTSEPNAYDPEIISVRKTHRGKGLFKGHIREDETTVKLEHTLKAIDNDKIGGARLICGYRIISRDRRIPFIIEVLNKLTGVAVIKVGEGKRLDYEKRKQYRFKVVAYDCSGIRRESESAVVKIRVIDVDEFAPVFARKSFILDVEEGKLNSSIIQLVTYDKDRSTVNKKVCGFKLVTPDVPFEIDSEGRLGNTEPLDYSLRRNYILEVVAVDCGKKKSKPVKINIKVKEICKSGWREIPTYLDYPAGSGQQKLLEHARLSLCDETCKPDKILVHMKLQTKHIGKGCDRDTYSITSQRKICGASGDNVDLLPTPNLATSWTKPIPTDDGHDSDKIFAFDGESVSVDVPKTYFDPYLGKHFTISTWMKREYPDVDSEEDLKKIKEHILCLSDSDAMNRHHYSWFVHGKKLVFLLRQEAEEIGDVESFKPAEWRWLIPQVSDGDWHHYAISVDFPEVRLYIDGKLLLPDDNNLEIADDLSLHPTSRVHDTKLVIGAAWQGKESKYKHFFKGYLAGLSILKGKTESDRVIKCLNNCKENLDFHALSEMQSGTTVSFNSEMTEFSITGKNRSEVQNLVREVTYVNSRIYPTPGRRNLIIETSVECGKKLLSLPEVETYVMVHQSSHPVIYINGKNSMTSTIHEMRSGVKVFDDVLISATPALEDDMVQDEEPVDDVEVDVIDINLKKKMKKKRKYLEYKKKKSKKQQATLKEDLTDDLLLDTCTIRADPPLDLRYEKLTLPKHLMEQFGITMEDTETNAGLIIRNADKIANYRMVLRGVHYFHFKAENLAARRLILSCSSQSGRFISNEHQVKIMTGHEEPVHQFYAHAQADESKLTALADGNLVEKIQGATESVAPHFGMAAIIVVCVGFLLFMIVLGVIRIRAAHRRTQVLQVKEEEEMEWDNSGLNITVNPMEQEIFDYEENVTPTLRDESDSDEDDCSYHDDEESSDEEQELKKDQELEWDNSTLSI